MCVCVCVGRWGVVGGIPRSEARKGFKRANVFLEGAGILKGSCMFG